MSRRTLRAVLAAGAAALLTLVGTAAQADPTSTPGQPIPGKDPNQLYAAVGADAFAELSNELVRQYNTQDPAPTNLLESFDAVNPSTGAAGGTITTKPGCTDVPRANGANAGITAILANEMSTVQTDVPCIDWVRSSRGKGSSAPGEANLTFFAQSRDAVDYAVVGHAYAPTAPLTTQQLKDIFECVDTDWSQVGGQPGPIHLYLPSANAATWTFFLTAIGSNVPEQQTACTGVSTTTVQQNDGRDLDGDPLGIAPYAVTKWAAQDNGAPGIADNRGGVEVGLVNTTTSPLTTSTKIPGHTYEVLNPEFATGDSQSFGRTFYNVVRNSAPDELKGIFGPDGFLCTHQDELLIPFGNTPLGTDVTAARYCGQAS